MALSFLRSQPLLAAPPPGPDGSLSFFDGALLVWNTTAPDGSSFTSRQLFKANSPHTGRGRESTATPPEHWHLEQVETLEVLEGTMTYLLDGVESTAKPGDKVVVQPGQVHTFWSGSDQDLLMQATTTGGASGAGFDDSFVRNFYGYLSSCVAAGVAPSPFQVFRFLDSAGVAVAAPLGLGRVMNVALGSIGGGLLLGYRTEYPEFAAAK
ncbi:hypothetical protein DMC30DRAFT_54920 [Rhodotorula diobovata]|uniref:Cupin type-2 domain-containing protein n=1 Tax=Rhodotorula diobovata TaxID=5288 RepID=A0A5C5FP88_9BASI|nr:hypothetical protein DMC30DRAFT_54920 [Rhodotorula diobovata]